MPTFHFFFKCLVALWKIATCMTFQQNMCNLNWIDYKHLGQWSIYWVWETSWSLQLVSKLGVLWSGPSIALSKVYKEKFTGKNDFNMWKIKMEALLISQGLGDAIEPETKDGKVLSRSPWNCRVIVSENISCLWTSFARIIEVTCICITNKTRIPHWLTWIKSFQVHYSVKILEDMFDAIPIPSCWRRAKSRQPSSQRM